MKFSSFITTFIIGTIAVFRYTVAAPFPETNFKNVPGKYFDRVVIFIFENQNFIDVNADPFFGSLASQYNGVTLTNFLALTHPSQPNYIGLITGTTDGVIDDSEVTVDRSSIVDLLEAKGVSWKAYMEGFVGNCNLTMIVDTYRRKHNPFISVKNIQENPERCAKIVNADQLKLDIEKDQVPQYVFYTPDMNNDAHNTNISYASNWFKNYIDGDDHIINKPAFNKNTMFVSIWDEDRNRTVPNQIQTVLFGPDFHKSTIDNKDDTAYDHYSLLRTIEDNWDLGTLGQNDDSAIPIKI
ncbi:unnamed protein product [Cunninghamella blakesleeana]